MPENTKTIQEQYRELQSTYEDLDTNIKNKSFIQEYDNAMLYINQLIEENATAYRVFNLLAHKCNSNNTILITYGEIAKIIGKSEDTVKRAIKALKQYNFLTSFKISRENIYFLNPYIVFNSKATYKSKLYHTYQKYSAHNTVDPQIELTKINEKELEAFNKKARLKYYFDFQNKSKDFHDPDIMDILNKIETLELADEVGLQKLKDAINKLEPAKTQAETPADIPAEEDFITMKTSDGTDGIPAGFLFGEIE